ncbi:hypothetical protein ABC347_00940 [Sphingomonas sp. 1P06PA]|uniref:hypothetical protein n=1 Tax=Sphingomonas sp. 1P06PA TaxID=554121 RepID=UPI0039A6D620
MSYSVDYSGEHPEQSNIASGEYPPQTIRYIEVPRRGIAIPSIVKTFTTFLLGGAALFSLETMGPVQFRPSTIMGTYDSRVEEQVKAAEMCVSGRFEGWAAQVKVSAEQNVEQYKSKSQAVIAAYQAGVERAKVFAQLTGQLQSQLAGAQLARVSGEQAGEVGMISMGRVFGDIMNAFAPGSGDPFQNYAEMTHNRLETELEDAVLKGAKVTIEGWDTGLPPVIDLQRQLDSIQPMKVPPMPSLGPDPSSDR